jgi:hypothetical protein
VSQAKKLEGWRDAFTSGEDREVTFTLLLTKRCCFACAHCMFAAGPGLAAEWMMAKGQMADGQWQTGTGGEWPVISGQ